MTAMTIPLNFNEIKNRKFANTSWNEQSLLPDGNDIKFSNLIKSTWGNSQKQQEMNEFISTALNKSEHFVKMYGKVIHNTTDSKSRIDAVNKDYIFEFRSRNFNLFSNDGYLCWKVYKHDRSMLCSLSKFASLCKYREQGKKPLYISFLYGQHFIVNDYHTFENSTIKLLQTAKLKNNKLRYFAPSMNIKNGGGYDDQEDNYYLPYSLSKIFINKNKIPSNNQIGKISFNNPNIYV
jgi:hypothetical protein